MQRSLAGRPQTVEQDGWREDAACRTDVTAVSPEHWFQETEARAALAKAICARCPVQEVCLDYALRTQQPWGVWGGQTATERGTAYGQVKVPAVSDPDRPQSAPEQPCPGPSVADAASGH